MTTTTKTIGGGTLTITPKAESYGEQENWGAFAVIKSDGSVFAWGDKNSGGDISSVASQLDGIIPVTQIFSNGQSFTALRSDGSVVTWGDANSGGDSSYVSTQLNGDIDVTQIYSSSYAFAAIRSDGSVVTWGNKDLGGDSSIVSSQLSGAIPVTQIYSNSYAFAAIRSDSSIVSWGQGGWDPVANQPTEIYPISIASQLNGSVSVTGIFPTYGTFTAVRSDGTIVGWGDGSSGDVNISKSIGWDSIQPELNSVNPVIDLAISDSSFAALRKDGSVISWGEFTDFSTFPSYSTIQIAQKVIARELNGNIPVVKIYASDFGGAFAALRKDGSVFTWGNKDCGGDSNSVAKQLDGTIDVKEIYSSDGAFAALRTDGSVVSWGKDGWDSKNKPLQIDTSTVADKLNGKIDIVKIYSNYSGFAALRTDGSVVTWGQNNDSSAVENDLNGDIDVTDIYSAGRGFAALRVDGSVVVWGMQDTYDPATNRYVPFDSKAISDQLTDVVSFANPATNDVYIAPVKEIHINHAPTGNITITGIVKQEQTLTIKNSLADADGLGDFSYQWLSNGKEISGATNDSYILSATDIGKKISVQVSYLDGEGTEELVTSKTTAAIANSTSTKSTSGNDDITGTAKAEKLDGLAGNDLLKGLGGNDTLIGGAGLDTLLGGEGADNLTGGKESDIFKFTALADSGITSKARDTITDFFSGTDKIDLSAIDANEKLAGDQAFTFIGSAAFSKTNASGQLRFDSTSKILYASTDADTTPEFSIQLSGVKSLVVGDFIL